ncbi:sacsin-like, partial [Dendronephthya gigantea]|uniref:sacsin-like n=1 Tax=Dendronephthya gigantea TaxID=151771 RepID=UPI00106AF283
FPGSSFGPEPPPLTDLLKNILLRYPDGGQILKELIQNADDAGANEVKILFDATSYGTDSLVSPELALFQGPALYFYNNAKFADEDWKGLQSLMRSNKENNLLKVGRFGIGFNSVYHITDLPSVVSDKTVAFLDPHEKYFGRGEPGQSFSTEDPLLAEHFSQFEPFHQLFDCRLEQGRSYGGTLFRFPLRNERSKLSNKIYTREMVDNLFDSFKKEAGAILLFLKNVDSVSLYKREHRGKISHLYTAKVSEQSKIEVRKRRQELIQDITVEWDFAVKTNFFRLEIERESPGKPPEKNEWFLANQVGTNEKNLIRLARDLKLLPWIGIAFPLDANNNMSSLGRIFCFLPLPPDGDCRTGLPVQVNGYFGLTDNRRALKWPGPDCQNDETAEWNELLLRKVGSQVYANLITNMVQERSHCLTQNLLAKLVYDALPDLSRVREDWKCILQPFFGTVLVKDIFLTAPRGISRWINLGAAIIDRLHESKDMREEIKRVVLKTLLGAGQPIVSLPGHVIQIIDQYHQVSGWGNVQQVTPDLLCNVLRSNSNIYDLGISFQDGLLDLEYALQTLPKNSNSLHGVPLLPLENGQFINFSIFSDRIYISSEKHSVDLLPNMKHRLLYRNLSQPLQQKLNELGSSAVTQLRHPTCNDIKELLWENLPEGWSCNYFPQLETVTWNPHTEGHPSLAWLELVWKWINENYPSNLSEFNGMPLIPLSISLPSSMARLRKNSAIIVSEHPLCNEKLSETLCELLKRSNCIVVENLPCFVRHYNIFQYISLPRPAGILHVLSLAQNKIVQQLDFTESNASKRELCQTLSRLDRIDSTQNAFIRTLPIFEAVDGRHFLSCESERNEPRLVAPRNFDLPDEIQIIDRAKIISSSNGASYRLLEKLNMRAESTASLIRNHLEIFLKSKNKKQVKDKLMLWILDKIDMLNKEMPNFVTFIAQLTCIPTDSGKYLAPNQLFDNSDGLLTQLLRSNNDAFPTSLFLGPIQRRKYELRVRRREDLTAHDIHMVVNGMTNVSLEQGIAVVELLNQRPQLLREYTEVGRPLNVVLRDLPWLPRVCDRPKNYPELMPWYDGMKLCKPSNMCPDSLAILVGATVPVFNKTWVSNEVQGLLGMSEEKNAFQEVIEQLNLAVASWKRTTQLSVGKFEEMIKSIYMYLARAPKHAMQQLLQSKGLTRWVWHGKGFTSPEKVALESPFPRSINLNPNFYRLPNELFKAKDFLLSLGVKPQFNVDDLLVMLSNIKEKHDNENGPREDAMQDLDQCRAVLEWIVRSCGELSDERRSNLLIPVQTASGKLQLEPCNKCTYCDREFLRRGASEFEVSTKSFLIHKAIPDDLAGRLRVPRLSSCLAGAKALGVKFKEAGQYEPLTTRLRNILQQYKEGVAIFKEIIQNADDARASKVFFVVDWRENPREQLLTEELAKCQGPALWAFNDAMFSEADFENINKLAGETKKDDLDKVGRFGIGFNSVYHLTDVPSFVSGEHIVFFDPNMNHISTLMDGKMRKGGIMLNLVENKHVLTAFPHQFMPYHQIFGCDMKGTGPFHFEGTLFRLPFRTAEQAEESEISKEPYTRDNVKNLIKSLKESASNLLLFTQNVNEVRLFEIRNSNLKTSLGRAIISIRKSVEKTLYKNFQGSILENSSKWLVNIRQSGVMAASEVPRCTVLLKMNISMLKSHLSEVSEVVKTSETWLVNSCMGGGSSLQKAQSADGKKNAVVPVTGVAAMLTLSNIHGVKVFTIPGEVFCFMPLPISSGLPVHVNGSFSVHSNRRRLWEEGVGEDKFLKPFEAEWNEAIMEDSLVQTYLQLLQDISSYNTKQYEFHTLWPDPPQVNYPKAWKPFLHSFFNQIIDGEWTLFYCNKSWRKLQDCLILDSRLDKVTECVAIMTILGGNILSLPPNFIEAFKSHGKETFMRSRMLTEDRFLREFFFPNVSGIPKELRNSVLLYILDQRLSKERSYDELLQTSPSFRCSKDGTVLRCAKELVHPKGKAACLFDEEEKRFPLDDPFLEKGRAMMLEELGMAIDLLPWSSLCERAEWVSDRGDAAKARLLIQYLNEMPRSCEITDEEARILRAAKFLPISSKPEKYPFPWKFDEICETKLAAADNLYPHRYGHLVGSSHLILAEAPNSPTAPNESLKRILGFTTKKPELSDVIAQLDRVIEQRNHITREIKEFLCRKIYEFFRKIACTKKYKEQKSYLRKQLECRPWMLVKGEMVDPKLVACNWKNEDGAPYLFALPTEYSRKFEDLLSWYGIRDTFRSEDFIEAIFKLRKDYTRKRVSDETIRTLIVFLENVFSSPETKPECPLPLPSADGKLYDADELAINETPWLETDGTDIKIVHEKIPVMLAYKCGAKDLRNADLARSSEPFGQPFGQHESLTDRLKNILKVYPEDEGILKELLQNADDAKATEIHFIFDPRTHGTKHVFSEGWKELQGPAICVYNNQPFSKEDIKGIQDLGIGSKVGDPDKTGQYGIGFNAVYHLTDCPFFISNDEVICVFDPHAAYAPGANESKPGRLFNKLDQKFRRNYCDVFSSLLDDLFDTTASTMFRFPLRGHAKLQPNISTTQWDEEKARRLFKRFRESAKNMLLFLNNITKISISEIKGDKLETYAVECVVPDCSKRTAFSKKIKECSKMPTQEIQFQPTHYAMVISDTENVKEDWLITQSLGYTGIESDSKVPNGTKIGLLPRAGIAICLTSTVPRSSFFRFSLLCVLPLPVNSNFPVHINGHFALNESRRVLWYDSNGSDERHLWNNFMKRQVIAPAYANAIFQARKHIPRYQAESDTLGTFPSKKEAEDGLVWYHQLFPSIENLDTSWKPVGEALYKHFLPMFPVLPVALSVPEWKRKLQTDASSVSKEEEDQTPVKVTWCKVNDAYFCISGMSWSLEKTLLDIGFHLLSHTPWRVHKSFSTVECNRDATRDRVREFLSNHREVKGDLPKHVKDTFLRGVENVREVTKYCAKEDKFLENLEGLPLLLTQDGILHSYHCGDTVFCSKFSKLLPFRPDLFLENSLRAFYSSDLKKCSNVMQQLTIPDLARFQTTLFPPTWIGTTSHQPWSPNSQDNAFPSKDWLVLLWNFINSVSKKMENDKEYESKLSNLLDEIAGWHIFPTTHNCLVPVSMGKTVLNVSTYINSDTLQDKTRRNLLVKLGCPQLNLKIIAPLSFKSSESVKPTGATAVCKKYLAMIQSTEDVLGLLHRTLNGVENVETILKVDEIQQLLMFLQSCCSQLSSSLLVELPFYQTISETYSRISKCNGVYEVPDNVPVDDLQVLASVTDSIFLLCVPKLADLYRHVGIKEITPMDFYLFTVLRHFEHLSPSGRVNHLKFVRDQLLHEHCESYEELLSLMKKLPFISDHLGKLHPADEFYDPENEIFQKFVPSGKFPPEPFDSDRWKEFLEKVGLQCSVTQDHFMQYAYQLEMEARDHPNADPAKEILKKSSFLVSHLYENQSLHESSFLSQISRIEFVPAAKIRKLYLDIFPAHTNSILTRFKGSVVESKVALVWSSASIIAAKEYNTYGRRKWMKSLGIHFIPPCDFVISHIKNISGRFSPTNNKEIPANLRANLVDVTTNIYSFFKELCNVDSSRCSCENIGRVLRDVPVIMVDQHTFVRGNQLAFNGVGRSMNPYMFKIPRSLQQFEHFLKRLGAQEYPTPLQCSSVLEAIKRSCGNKNMLPGEISSAVSATKSLFVGLSYDRRRLEKSRDSTCGEEQSLANVHNLYLPTEDNYLMRSCEVFFNDTMERKERLKDYREELLIDLTMRDQETPAKLVELLPSHLKVQKLSSKLNEELCPSCAVCIADQDPMEPSCDFINRYRDIICSHELEEALIRLYKFQEKVAIVPKNVENELRSLKNSVKVSCMNPLKVRLVTRATNEPIPDSESDVLSFCQENEDGFSILIKHGEKSNPSVLHEMLSSFICRVTVQHISKDNWRFLMMILGVRDSSEISKTLDDARVPTIDSNTLEPSAGDRIPDNVHDFLKNNINYHLREGEWVGYAMQEESEEDDAVYIFAKIVEQTSQGEGKFAFNSRYRIDIGEKEPIEVSKLKLYKFDRESREAVGDERGSRKETMDVAHYEGDGTEFDVSRQSTTTAHEPAVLEDAKKEVAEALKEIWESLGVSDRTSAVRRLIRRWHPDRNLGRQSFATEVTQFLLNEVERLERGGEPGYHPDDGNSHQSARDPTWNGPDFREYFRAHGERTRRRRQPRDERRHAHDDGTEPANSKKAAQWMRQAEKDFDTASYLFRSDEESYYSYTCFLCQQAAEKALKALMLAKGFLERSDLDGHDDLGLAYRASEIDPRLRAIPEMVGVMHARRYYIKTRYPYYTREENPGDDSIPSELFSRDDAEEALAKTREILQLLRKVMV